MKSIFLCLSQNLVDLAGSERASQTGAEGKELPFYTVVAASLALMLDDKWCSN